jgi:hypothetical protein
MTGDDVPLYTAWRANPVPIPTTTYFNVRVGPLQEDLTGAAGPDAALRAQLLALRIDALVFDGATWWILEFHGQAGIPALGRLLAYPDLLRTTYTVDPPLRSLMIAHTANPFLLPIFAHHHIPVLAYPNPGSPPINLNAVSII